MSKFYFRENPRTGRDNVVIEGAHLIWKNFSGEETQFNRAGNRNFNVIIDDPDFADELLRKGWNVREKQPRDEGDDPYFVLACAVSFRVRPPKIMIYTGHNRTELHEDTVGMLDYADIVNVDLELNGSHWEVNGNSGIKAYVNELHVTIEEGAFDEKYADYD